VIPPKIVVDTDLLIGHVAGKSPSMLRRFMSASFCYTTVFNAIEAFSLCRTPEETQAVEETMNALKILGLNAKSGKNIGALFASARKSRDLQILAAGVCMESRLPLVTGRPAAFRGIGGLELIPARRALALIGKV
jgi:predicted nucleic acid-binding protein